MEMIDLLKLIAKLNWQHQQVYLNPYRIPIALAVVQVG